MRAVELNRGGVQEAQEPQKTGWLRITLRTGLMIGMVSQLIVLSDLKTMILGGEESLPWFTGPAARPTAFAVLAATAWAAAFWWGRSRRATAAGAIACLFSWSYYGCFPPSGQWCFFATSQHFVLFLLPLFPFLLLATGTVLRDAVVEVRRPTVPQARRTGFEAGSILWSAGKVARAVRTFLERLENSLLFVPCVYGLMALIFLLHPDLFRWNEDIHSALRQSWNLTWPYNFAWLPQLAALALTMAAALRRTAISRNLALFGSVAGCVYSGWAFEAMKQHLVDAKRYPDLRTTPLAPDSYYLAWLSVSLAPIVLAFFFAARDAKKHESIADIFLRVAATLCFCVFALSAHFEENRSAIGVQWLVLVFGMAYLSSVVHPASWRDYVLGVSVGLAVPIFRVFGFPPRVPPAFAPIFRSTTGPYGNRDAILLLAVTLSNMLLVLAVAANSVPIGKNVRMWRVLAGLGAALLFDALVFAAILVVG